MKFVVCLRNQDYSASLEVRKLYQVLEDPQANQHQMLRIIDESGEDYLYPASYFAAIDVPESIQQVFAAANESMPLVSNSIDPVVRDDRSTNKL